MCEVESKISRDFLTPLCVSLVPSTFISLVEISEKFGNTILFFMSNTSATPVYPLDNVPL